MIFGKKENRPPLENTVLLKSPSGEVELALIRGILEEEGIPYCIKHRESSSFMRVLAGYSIFGSDIYVEKNDYEKAKSLVDTYCKTEEESNGDEETDEEDIPEVDEDELIHQAEEATNTEDEKEQPSSFSLKTLIIMIIVAVILLVCVKLVGGMR